MRIKVLSGTIVDGKRVEAGKTVDASDSAAYFLLAIGKAEEAAPPKTRTPEDGQPMTTRKASATVKKGKK